MQAHPELKAMVSLPEESDEEEVFVDMPEDEETPGQKDVKSKAAMAKATIKYDGRRRDPQFSNADKTCLWDLVCLELNIILAVFPWLKRNLLFNRRRL